MQRADYSSVCHSCAVGGQNVPSRETEYVSGFGVERRQEVKGARKRTADGWSKGRHGGVAG